MPDMGWQLAIVCLTVAAAAVYLVRQAWRSWSGRKSGCGGSCGCSNSIEARSDGLIPAEQLTLRPRRPGSS